MKKKTLKEQVGMKVNKNAYVITSSNMEDYVQMINHVDKIEFDKSIANVAAKELDKMIFDDLKKNSLKVKAKNFPELSELAIQKIYNKTKRFMPNIIITKDKKLVTRFKKDYKIIEYKELKENEFLFIVNQPDLLITPIYYNDSGMQIDYKYNKNLVAYGVLEK